MRQRFGVRLNAQNLISDLELVFRVFEGLFFGIPILNDFPIFRVKIQFLLFESFLQRFDQAVFVFYLRNTECVYRQLVAVELFSYLYLLMNPFVVGAVVL